jgi:hypothetical protein
MEDLPGLFSSVAPPLLLTPPLLLQLVLHLMPAPFKYGNFIVDSSFQIRKLHLGQLNTIKKYCNATEKLRK